MSRPTGAKRALDLALGAGSLLAIAALVGVAVLAYNKAFVPSDKLMLRAGTVGNALQKGSDVKLNGVPVGTVRAVHPVDGGAELTLNIDPSTMKQLPKDTTARLLPKTLFGERYVALIVPADDQQSTLSGGDTIHQDSSAKAQELQQVFDKLLPLLRSIQPEKLAATMGSMATMLRGNGDDIGTTLTQWADYLQKLNPHVPQMAEDFARLASVAHTYDNAAPDLLNALDTLTTTSKTLVDQQSQLKQVYSNVISGSDDANGWVTENQNTIEVLSSKSRSALQAVSPYASEFPCVFAAARKFIPRMDKVLGKGSGEPGIHVKLSIVPSRGKYVPGKDAPRYTSGKKPRCPYVTGQTGTKPLRTASAGSEQPDTIAPPPNRLLADQVSQRDAGIGQANSPAENQMIGELLAADSGLRPTQYPDWASLMVGPLLRNTKVVLR